MNHDKRAKTENLVLETESIVKIFQLVCLGCLLQSRKNVI